MGDSAINSAAMRYLKASARTRLELVERLVLAGHVRDESERVVGELFEKGLIDERAIAGAEVREGVRAGRSRGEIERLLVSRGIEESMIRAAVADEEVGGDAVRVVDAARELARRAAGVGPEARLRRVLAGLARRGFDEETAVNAAREVLGRDLGACGEG